MIDRNATGRIKGGRRMVKGMAFVLAAAMLLLAAGCGGSTGQADAKKDTVLIYDGNYAEYWLVHRMVKLLVEEYTDAKVDIREKMTGVLNFTALVNGDTDLMNNYDGSVLTTYLHLDVTDIPEGTSTYDFVYNLALEEKGVMMLDKMGFFNTYVMAVTQPVYEKYGMETITDLASAAPNLIFGAEHDFFSEEGMAKYNPLCKFYGLNFKDYRSIDIGLKYSAMDSGNIDCTVAYSTDGLNKKYKLHLLDDDRAYFPEYNGCITVRATLFDEMKDVAPNLKEVINMLGGRLSNEIMTDLSYQVDVEGKDPMDVARACLKELGLIK